MFIPSSIGLFLVNILRVYLLIVIGASISPDLALTLFHTYAGIILFIIYFLLFWLTFYKWMKK
jgi:exosortase/archaeosortase family protein